MSETAASKERFHFLDGLRGIASLMIVVHHAFTSNIAKELVHRGLPALGYYLAFFTQSGVELFFVLSGVVLLRPYLRGERQFRPFNYLLRRIKRIWPPYLVALMFAACVCWSLYAFPTWYTTKVYHLEFYWPEILKEAYIFNFSGYYYNLAWWSLSIELLFYLLVPLILLIFPRSHKLSDARVWALITGTMAVSLTLQYWLNKYHPSIYSYERVVPDTYQAVRYPLCFLLGIFLAARDFSLGHARAFIISGIAVVLISWYWLPLENMGYGLLYAGIIIFAFHKHSVRKILSRPGMLWLGERSYSLFLVHFSVFYLTDSLAARFTSSGSMAYAVFSRAVGIPLAFFVAMLLFTFVEQWQARGLITAKMFWPWQARKLDH